MKKIVVVLLSVFLLICGCFFAITAGRSVTREGLTENSRIYITDFKIENRRLHYTVVNQTFRRVPLTSIVIERKEAGVWREVKDTLEIDVLGDKSFGRTYYCEAFSRLDRSTDVTRKELYEGEYRAYFLYRDSVYVVGYFTIDANGAVTN